MKLLTLLCASLAVVLVGCGKTLERDGGGGEGYERVVLAELYTAVWCANCPEAEAALDRLYDEETTTNMAVVHWHPSLSPGDPLAIPMADSRTSMYFGSDVALPTCVFDGLGRVVGANETVYDQYRSRFDAEAVILSPVRITLTPSSTADSAIVAVSVEAHSSGSEITADLVVVLVEHRVANPGEVGPDTLSYVARAAVETEITVAPGSPASTTVRFALDGGWRLPMMHVVAFVQRGTDLEVLQAAMVPLGAQGSYGFSFTAPDTSVVVPIDTTLIPFTITNTGTLDDSLEIDLPASLQSLPSGWSVALCDTTGVCFPTPKRIFLAAGASILSLGVDLIADSYGAGASGVVVRSLGDTTIVDTITFTIATVAPPYGVDLYAPILWDTCFAGLPCTLSFTVTNTGSNADTVRLDLPPALNVPPFGWTYSISDATGIPFALPYPVYLTAGGVVSDLMVYVATLVPDTATVALVAWSTGDPTMTDTVFLHVTAN